MIDHRRPCLGGAPRGTALAGLGILVAASSVAAPPVRALEPSADGPGLLARAARVADLRAVQPGNVLLQATVRLVGMADWPGQVADGSYKLLVLDASHWREELAFSGWAETNARSGEVRWRARTRANKPMRMFQASRTADPLYHLRLAQRATVTKVEPSTDSGRSVVCLELKGPEKERSELCLDPASGVLVSARYHNPESLYTFSGEHVLEDKVVPHLLRCSEAAEDAVAVEVTSVSRVNQLDPALFAPPARAFTWPYCDDPTPPRVLSKTAASQSVHAKATRQFGTVMCIGEVAPNGYLQDIAVVQSRGGLLDQAVKQALAGWRWEPARCGATPVPYEVKVLYTFLP